MKRNWLYRLLFFISAFAIGTELSRISFRKITLSLMNSYLSEFQNPDSYLFNLYHILTEYLPLVIFSLATFALKKSSKFRENKKLFLPCITALISSISILALSDKYYELCKSWFFTMQIGIIISYYFATLFVIKEVKIKERLIYFVLSLFFASFFDQTIQWAITQIENGYSYFPYRKIDGIILAIYLVLTGALYTFYKRKILN